jgi:hypothetical protein
VFALQYNEDCTPPRPPFPLFVLFFFVLRLSTGRPMLARLFVYSLLLLSRAFAQRQPPLHAEETIVSNRILREDLVAPSGEGGKNEGYSIESDSTAALATGSRFRYTVTESPPERRLVTPITDTASLQTAIGEWCNRPFEAANTYGDISTWCDIIILYICPYFRSL